ncbi:MAG: hypothetical protein JO148_12355 [Acidimicrobiia bacterium]|nr:hypothetical protein [Acidimicrobiia bacterium]
MSEIGANDDAVLAALDRLTATLEHAANHVREVRERCNQHALERRDGRSWEEIVAEEQCPPLVDLLNTVATGMADANNRYRVAVTKALHREGMSMRRIGEVLGVTRQRVSVLLKSALP